MQTFRFHVVGLPHTKVTKEFLPCAYTQKVLNFCKMMKGLGHEVYLYAGEGSDESICTEFIPIITDKQQQDFFGHTDWRKEFFPIEWNENLPYWILTNNNAISGIIKRSKPKDFVCIIGGTCQSPIVEALKGHIVVEFGVGYAGITAPFRIFESYAWMHYVYGDRKFDNGQAFDAVIPNYFDPADFPFSAEKDDYFLYIGRMISRKGPHIVAEVCGNIGAKLIMAGQGAKQEGNVITAKEFTIKGDHLQYVGTVGIEERGKLISRARAVFVPTQYIGPFEGVHIEAMMCGTPVITTDWGVFPETVIDGFNGFRTRTIAEMMWATQVVDKLDYKKIREYAINNFSLDRVRSQYQAYFEQLYTLWGKGYYEQSYDASNKRYHKYDPTS